MQTKVITIYNNKGGVGKTTVAHNLAVAIAEMTRPNYKTLLIDLDQQYSLTEWVLPDTSPEKTIYDVYMKEKISPIPLYKNLDFIGSSSRTALLNAVLTQTNKREDALRRGLEQYMGKYDFIIIDCPPAMGLTMITAFAVTDYLVVPALPEPTSYDAIAKLKEDIESLNEEGVTENLSITGIVLNQYNDRSAIARETITKIVKEFPGLVFKSVVRDTVTQQDAYKQHMDVFRFYAKYKDSKEKKYGFEKPGDDFFNLANEFLERIKNS